ncbi:MAG TPA: hypothetical protein VKJ45_21385 [Blastocatellia bacterium]|nr:hypothetical protein [Blastocatellia bacterium]
MRNWIERAMRIAVKIIVFGTIAIVVFGFVVMSLWNWLMPALFRLPVISFWQALGLVILSKILFGGLHSHQNKGRHRGCRMRDRWEHMTPEERQKFREGLRGRSSPATTELKYGEYESGRT